MVVESDKTDSLFKLDNLLSICEIEKKLKIIPQYYDMCQTENDSKKCCRPWTIPNYIALLSNKTSCFEIQVK